MSMSAASPSSATSAAELARRWSAVRVANPKLRIRDAAKTLCTSEAELVATGCGTTAIRLQGPWGDLLKQVPTLGRVMALTRNEQAVHERYGTYKDVSVSGPMGLVLGPDIDLRLFLKQWHFGFAVVESTASGARRSLQFFDASGQAVHKIYATADTDAGAWDQLVSRCRNSGQSPELAIAPAPEPAVARPDAEIDLAGLRGAWRDLRDTHDFFGMLRKFDVQRDQAFRLVGPEFAQEVAPLAVRTVLESVAAGALPIMIFVGNPGAIQIHSGTVTTLKTVGPWFNVLDPEFNLHLREDRIAAVWLVRKPTSDGIVTSVEAFDASGAVIAMLFGKRKPGNPELEAWRDLAADLAVAERAA